jgi:hypothetical protein
MTIFARLPIQLIARAMEDFKRSQPYELHPIMQASFLAEQLKVDFAVLEPILIELNNLGMIRFHPMWPTILEFQIMELK